MITTIYQVTPSKEFKERLRLFHKDFMLKGLKLIYNNCDEDKIKLLSDTFDEIYDFNTNDEEKVNAFNIRLNNALESLNDILQLTMPQIERTYKQIEDLRQEAVEELHLLNFH